MRFFATVYYSILTVDCFVHTGHSFRDTSERVYNRSSSGVLIRHRTKTGNQNEIPEEDNCDETRESVEHHSALSSPLTPTAEQDVLISSGHSPRSDIVDSNTPVTLQNKPQNAAVAQAENTNSHGIVHNVMFYRRLCLRTKIYTVTRELILLGSTSNQLNIPPAYATPKFCRLKTIYQTLIYNINNPQDLIYRIYRRQRAQLYINCNKQNSWLDNYLLLARKQYKITSVAQKVDLNHSGSEQYRVINSKNYFSGCQREIRLARRTHHYCLQKISINFWQQRQVEFLSYSAFSNLFTVDLFANSRRSRRSTSSTRQIIRIRPIQT